MGLRFIRRSEAEVEMRKGFSEIIQFQPRNRNLRRDSVAVGSAAVGALALGAIAVGALAIGAVRASHECPHLKIEMWGTQQIASA